MLRKRWQNREKIQAVHDNDLEAFLSSLGILEDITEGKYKCFVCEDLITLNNIGMIFPYKNKVKLVCEKHSCISYVNTELKRKE